MPRSRPSSVRGVAVLVGCALLGAAAAVLGTIVHQKALLTAGGARPPLGLLLAVALTAATAGLLRALRVPMAARVAAVLAWLAVAFAAAGSSGDVLVPDNARGYGWLLAGLAVLVVVLLLPARARTQRRG